MPYGIKMTKGHTNHMLVQLIVNTHGGGATARSGSKTAGQIQVFVYLKQLNEGRIDIYIKNQQGPVNKRQFESKISQGLFHLDDLANLVKHGIKPTKSKHSTPIVV